MTIHRLLSLLFAFAMLTACEKLDLSGEDASGKANSGKTTSGASTGSTVDDEDEGDITVYTVSDLIDGEIADAFYDDADFSLPDVWVRGYIVGYVNSTTIGSAVFATGDKASNILLADSPLETNAYNCVPVQLGTSPAANKAVRTALNLSEHPENLGQKVRIRGTIAAYMGTIGLRSANRHRFLENDFDYEGNKNEGGTENGNENEGGNGNESGNGNEGTGGGGNTSNPTQEFVDSIEVYSVGYMLGTLTAYFAAHPTISQVSSHKVRGYIVGYVARKKTDISHTIFYGVDEDIDFRSQTNIVIADSPDERDWSNCIAVELPAKSGSNNIREGLNIKDHPENFERLVTVQGDIAPYMGALGIRNTYTYWFE